MKYKMEFLIGTNNRNFCKDLEEMIATMKRENENFQKCTILKRIVKTPDYNLLVTSAQILQKYVCLAYERKGVNELMRINYEDLLDKSFEGSCIVEVRDSYWDARETIILSVEEIVVTGPTYPRKVVCNADKIRRRVIVRRSVIRRRKLGCKIATLACENKGKTAKLKSLKPLDFELIKTTANGKYKNVYARIYTNNTGRVTCKLSQRKKVKGVFKRGKLKIGDLIDELFKGSCVLRVYQVYTGISKTITLSVKEIMATELSTESSYFDEYEEMVSDKSSSEEAD